MRVALSSGLAAAPIHTLQAQSQDAQAPASVASAVQEIVVTATRRAAGIETVPYNISAVSGDDLLRTGTQDIGQLAKQVPGFDMADRGRASLAGEIPIIRGMNTSNTDRNELVFEQAPVGTYLGDSPMIGYFPIEDVQRIEILRGPQGTLYGAGALGGAIRFIPNSPRLNAWEAGVDVSGSTVDHSSSMGYTYSGLLNAPLGSIAAIRLSARREHDPGFIDQYGIQKRQGDPAASPVILANPADVANSPAVYYSKKDVNYADVSSGRVSVLIQPMDPLKLELAVNVAHVRGGGSPIDTPDFAGGPWPLDPRITLPSGGRYENISPVLGEFTRTSSLSSIDASYDMGFATLSSTSTYYNTHARSIHDGNDLILNLPAGYRSYYTGNPVNPRFIATLDSPDANRAFTQELRLVSNGHHLFDYTVGLFHQLESHSVGVSIYEPGTAEQAAASGGLPVNTSPLGATYVNNAPGSFEEDALFGEVTWNATNRFQLTGGGRVFHQRFTQTQAYTIYLFDTSDASGTSSSFSDHIFKVNASYEYLHDQRVYATFSQGFRRGGANAFQTQGVLGEPAAILTYQPDKANNVELGLKGVLESGIRYTADVFHVDWDHPQLGTFTSVNSWPVVVNAPKARTQGAEFELHTPLFTKQLNLTLGYAYVDAKLTQNFCIPNGDGTGGVLPCGLSGTAGDRLPGSPKNSAVATLSYTQPLPDGSFLDLTLNANYKGSVLTLLSNNPYNVNPAYTLFNASATYHWNQWSVGLVGNNLFDRRVIYAGPLHPNSELMGTLSNTYSVGQPRTIAVRLGYHFAPGL